MNEAPVRILVASDVASEGINLHYLSHRMIHFDIPWSLMVFQQRNGRVDRYGQKVSPDIRYMVTRSTNEEIRGDMRILQVLIRKEAEANKNIGDVGALMNLYPYTIVYGEQIADMWKKAESWFAFRINLISAFLDYSRTHVPTNILGTFTISHRKKRIYVHIRYL